MRRRRLLVALAAVPFGFLFGTCIAIDSLGGAFRSAPSELLSPAPGKGLSPAARALLARVAHGIDPARALDVHTHVVGIGRGGTGAEVNPRMRSFASPFHHYKFLVYCSAAGIDDLERADERYVERLVELARHAVPRARHVVLAFDHHYSEDGAIDLVHTEFYVPNDHALAVAGAHPELFLAGGSVHPYRADALAELDRLAARGVRLIKWLPNAMGIDPASARCDGFYAKLLEHRMVLLTHTGDEQAVDAEEMQGLGNPLRLRRALDAGVTVIAAHCASRGTDEDLDRADRARVSSFGLFLRLLGEARYAGRLFGDISAMTQFNRCGEPLATLLAREDLQPRLVNGSDYPLPAINVLVRLGALVEAGYLDAADADPMREIYDHNPLAFDFALKRALRSPATGRGFADVVFHDRPELGILAR